MNFHEEVLEQLQRIIRKQDHMAATQADLDKAIAAVKAAVDALTPTTPSTPVDFQTQVDQLNAVITEINTKFPPPTSTPPTT